MPDDIADDLVAVLREALTNIARHARAGSAHIQVTVNDQLTLDVIDDGIGVQPTTRRSGLVNLQTRAERHHGTLQVAPNAPAGTRLSWSVPIP